MSSRPGTAPHPGAAGSSEWSRRDLTGHRQPVSCVAWSANGKRLASGDEEGVVKIWHIDEPVVRLLLLLLLLCCDGGSACCWYNEMALKGASSICKRHSGCTRCTVDCCTQRARYASFLWLWHHTHMHMWHLHCCCCSPRTGALSAASRICSTPPRTAR